MENTYWNHSGKYQTVSNLVRGCVPDTGKADIPSTEAYRVMSNAYYDYYNNGGCNRIRLKALLEGVKLPRGSAGSKAMSKLRKFSTKDGCCKYLPDGLEQAYEDIANGVLELHFARLIGQHYGVFFS